MPRLSFKLILAVLLLGVLVGAAAKTEEDIEIDSLLAQENPPPPEPAPDKDSANVDDEEIDVQALLDDELTGPAPASETKSEVFSESEHLKQFLPFKIFQSTNNAFVRTLSKNGKVTRAYTPPVCAGLSGSWEVQEGVLRIKEKLHCLVDPDQPGKYGRAWYQKVEFKLDYVKGKPTLNGVFLGKDGVFQVN